MTKTFFYKKESQNLIILQEEERKWKKNTIKFFFWTWNLKEKMIRFRDKNEEVWLSCFFFKWKQEWRNDKSSK